MVLCLVQPLASTTACFLPPLPYSVHVSHKYLLEGLAINKRGKARFGEGWPLWKHLFMFTRTGWVRAAKGSRPMPITCSPRLLSQPLLGAGEGCAGCSPCCTSSGELSGPSYPCQSPVTSLLEVAPVCGIKALFPESWHPILPSEKVDLVFGGGLSKETTQTRIQIRGEVAAVIFSPFLFLVLLFVVVVFSCFYVFLYAKMWVWGCHAGCLFLLFLCLVEETS